MASVADSYPRPGDTNVPVDIAPALVLQDPTCEPFAWELSLEEQDSGALIAEATVESGVGIVALPLSAPLAPDTAYALRAYDRSGLTAAVEIGFTTGSSAADTTPWTPVLSALTATWVEPDGPLIVDVKAAQPEGAERPRLVELGDIGPTADSGDFTARVGGLLGYGGGSGEPYEWSFGYAARPDAWCVSARGRADEGTWFDPAEPLCAPVSSLYFPEVEDTGADDTGAGDSDARAACSGCATPGGLPTGMALVAGLVAVGRRRRT